MPSKRQIALQKARNGEQMRRYEILMAISTLHAINMEWNCGFIYKIESLLSEFNDPEFHDFIYIIYLKYRCLCCSPCPYCYPQTEQNLDFAMNQYQQDEIKRISDAYNTYQQMYYKQEKIVDDYICKYQKLPIRLLDDNDDLDLTLLEPNKIIDERRFYSIF